MQAPKLSAKKISQQEGRTKVITLTYDELKQRLPNNYEEQVRAIDEAARLGHMNKARRLRKALEQDAIATIQARRRKPQGLVRADTSLTR